MQGKKIKETDKFDFYKIEPKSDVAVPLYNTPVSAGFPSPADDYIDLSIDFNKHLVKKPHTTFCVKVKGNSMEGANIFDGDLLVVDRAEEPTNKKIVLGVLNGEFTVKRIKKLKNELYLEPENKDFEPIKITEEMNFEVWGVVTYIIHKAK